DDDARHAPLQRGFHIVDFAGAAAHLHGDRDGCGDFRDDLEVGPSAQPGAVQVHDVKPGRAPVGKSTGQRHRVGPEWSDLLEISLEEAYRSTSQQVDRGDDQNRSATDRVILLAY
ncbi:MAG: hypothetical protein M3Z13_00775, partial [Candidatus Dormibacteraeota bacterium]|nr:hypothetical protein [Candidatus Dormibacteraeota bacterium]